MIREINDLEGNSLDYLTGNNQLTAKNDNRNPIAEVGRMNQTSRDNKPFLQKGITNLTDAEITVDDVQKPMSLTVSQEDRSMMQEIQSIDKNVKIERETPKLEEIPVLSDHTQ